MRLLSAFCLLALLAGTGTLFAQAGYSSGSVSLSRERAKKGNTTQAYPAQTGSYNQSYTRQAPKPQPQLAPEEVVIEEFINYHQHQIPIPDQADGIALSMNANLIERQEMGDLWAVQVGIATSKVNRRQKRDPVHVSIVVDGSGSMHHDQKMDKVKLALRTFVGELQIGDFVSIVRFSNDAEVIHPLTMIGEYNGLQNRIQSLYPSGSTNLFAGLKRGLEQFYPLESNYEEENWGRNITRRLILLTDGVANMGMVEPHYILREVQPYIQDGVQISTIGVGEDVNFELLKQLAKKSGGQNHFIGSDEEDIRKVFIQEVNSLLAPVAKDVSLTVDFPLDVVLEDIYASNWNVRRTQIVIALEPLNRGLTQVVIFTCLVPFEAEEAWLQATLSGHRPQKQELESWLVSMDLDPKDESRLGWADPDLKKNYHIALMALTLKRIAQSCKRYQDCAQAAKQFWACESAIAKAYYPLRDPDMIRVWDILTAHSNQWTAYTCGTQISSYD